MRNLAILTHAANKIENGPNTVDRRKFPKCADCRRVCQQMPDGTYQAHCWKHATQEERQARNAAWQPIWDVENMEPA